VYSLLSIKNLNRH